MKTDMMSRGQAKSLLTATILGAIAFSGVAVAVGGTDYSGTYVAQEKKGKGTSGEAKELRVVQTDTAIEVTSLSGQKASTNQFPLDGSEGDYTSPGGVKGKCKAEFKGKYLLLESMVIGRPNQNGPPVRLHTREKWQLSSDAKTLTIQTEIDFPDFPPGVAAMAIPNNPLTEKYVRADKP